MTNRLFTWGFLYLGMLAIALYGSAGAVNMLQGREDTLNHVSDGIFALCCFVVAIFFRLTEIYQRLGDKSKDAREVLPPQ